MIFRLVCKPSHPVWRADVHVTSTLQTVDTQKNLLLSDTILDMVTACESDSGDARSRSMSANRQQIH
jgi:hypothetical protein